MSDLSLPQQVQSLTDFGGPLTACAAVSYKNFIVIYPTAGTAASLPKAVWIAHSTTITKMHCSRYTVDLYSGALDGSISRCESCQALCPCWASGHSLKPCSVKTPQGLLDLWSDSNAEEQVISRNCLKARLNCIHVSWSWRRKLCLIQMTDRSFPSAELVLESSMEFYLLPPDEH